MEISLLTKKQVCGQSALSIFKKYGTNAAVTDFSILLGCGVTSDHTSDSSFYDYDTRSADYFTKTKNKNKIIAIESYGFEYNSEKHIDDRHVGIRPIIKYSDIKDYAYDEKKSEKGVLEVKFGEFPQTVCNAKLEYELEKLYQEGKLIKTDKIYTTDSNVFGDFEKQDHIEYKYKGEKYIRFIADKDPVRAKLSNQNYTIYNKPYWLKVEPITWMIDKEADIAVSKKILLSGMPYDIKQENEFEKTIIYNYLNTYFSKQIISSKINDKYTKVEYIEKLLSNLSLRELQELRIIIEEEMRGKVKRIGGIKWKNTVSKNK